MSSEVDDAEADFGRMLDRYEAALKAHDNAAAQQVFGEAPALWKRICDLRADDPDRPEGVLDSYYLLAFARVTASGFVDEAQRLYGMMPKTCRDTIDSADASQPGRFKIWLPV